MDLNKHRYYLMQVLLAIFRHPELSQLLAFKGGTSLMLFHGLTRFSTDLDFNLLDASKAEYVYGELHKLLLKFGTIDDEANKFFGPILVLNYGKGERMLKVEVSNREYPNHYEVRSLLGTDIRVMTLPDMFAHKLCALGERITPRDIYDVWFFLRTICCTGFIWIYPTGTLRAVAIVFPELGSSFLLKNGSMTVSNSGTFKYLAAL